MTVKRRWDLRTGSGNLADSISLSEQSLLSIARRGELLQSSISACLWAVEGIGVTIRGCLGLWVEDSQMSCV